MLRGFSESEAKKLIGQSFETRAPFSGVPLHTQGKVIEAIDSEDHWNVMIEWVLPGKPFKAWYSKHELRAYMHPVEASPVLLPPAPRKRGGA